MSINRIVKLFVVFLAVTLVLPALASETRKSGLYTYKLKGNGSLTITDFDWKSNTGDVYIPSMIDGYTVTAIGDEAFAEGMEMSSQAVIVVLPSTITTLGDKAFYHANISSINIPLSLQSIGKGAFAYSAITQFSVEPGHGSYAAIDGALYHKKSKTLVAYPPAIKELVAVPDGIVAIDDYAFSGMKLGITEFSKTRGIVQANEIIPPSVTRIGNYAFADATFYYTSEYDRTGDRSSREAILLPEGVVELGEYAFYKSSFRKAYYESTNPEKVTIGKNLASIGAHAFDGCQWFDGFGYDLYLSGLPEVRMIGEFGFANARGLDDSMVAGMVIIHLPSSISAIGKSAFSAGHWVDGSKLIYVNEIGENAFQNSAVFSATKPNDFGLVQTYSLDIPGTCGTIAAGAYSNNGAVSASTLEVLNIQTGITHIGQAAFSGHNALREVNLPDSLVSIDSAAFADCNSLVSLRIPSSVTRIAEDAFDRKSIVLSVENGSYAAFWAQENGYGYKYSDTATDDTSWLND